MGESRSFFLAGGSLTIKYIDLAANKEKGKDALNILRSNMWF